MYNFSMKRFFACLFVGLLFYGLIGLLNPVQAAGYPAPDMEYFVETIGKAGKGAGNKEGLDTTSLGNLMGAATCYISGCSSDPTHPLPYNKSTLASLGRFIDGMYQNPPANTYAFLLDTAQTLGFVPKTAYAQGVGFSGLSPLLPIWKIFRNIAYFLMAIVMVIIGFMVMLRKKIDPKTVVTVQNALPRIVITLILITFSYAIVGLMIDLMYLVILIFTLMLDQAHLLPDVNWFQSLLGQPNVQTTMTSGSLGQVFSLLFPYQIGPVNITLTELAFHIVGGWGTVAAGAVVGTIIGVLTGGLSAIVTVPAGAVSAPVLVSFLFSLALIFIFIRLFLMFLTTYINIVLSLLIGPLQLLLEAIPGTGGFEGWFKNLLANILVFPVSAIMFLIALFFIQATRNLQGSSLWSPPFNLVNGNANALAALFAIGILMVIPNVVGSIKEAIKAKAPVPVGPGALVAPLGAAYQTGAGVLSQFYYGQMIFGEGGMIGKLFKPRK